MLMMTIQASLPDETGLLPHTSSNIYSNLEYHIIIIVTCCAFAGWPLHSRRAQI